MKWLLINIIGWWFSLKLKKINKILKELETMQTDKKFYENLLEAIKLKNEEEVERCLKALNLIR
jgi:hypothetical protein